MSTNQISHTILILIGSVFILFIGKSLLVPLVLALLIWFLIISLRKLFMQIPVIGNKLPRWIWTMASTIIFIIVYISIINLLASNIQTLLKKAPQYTANLKDLNEFVFNYFNIDQFKLEDNLVDSNYLSSILSTSLKTLSSLFSNLFLIILYVVFIFSEEINFREKLGRTLDNQDNFNQVSGTLEQIRTSIEHYIGLKTIMSVLTAGLSYIVLLSIGVDSALFWSALIFLLNFIPSIGSLIATVFPALFAFLQFNDVTYLLLVFGLVGAIQIIVGNIVEPKVMGKSLNLSSLVVMLALTFWGSLWGLTGAILSVPITVMLMIIFSHFDSTKFLSRILSEKGEINP